MLLYVIKERKGIKIDVTRRVTEFGQNMSEPAEDIVFTVFATMAFFPELRLQFFHNLLPGLSVSSSTSFFSLLHLVMHEELFHKESLVEIVCQINKCNTTINKYTQVKKKRTIDMNIPTSGTWKMHVTPHYMEAQVSMSKHLITF